MNTNAAPSLRRIKKTKIIATISNTCTPEFLRSLHAAGVDVVRLNTAHQTPEEALTVIKNVRAASNRIAILVDTKGPEIRTTPTREDIPVKAGDIVYLRGAKQEPSSQECVCVTYDGIVRDLSINDRLLIDDGDIELTVVAKEGDRLKCRVGNDGSIKGRKGVNVPGASINLPSVTPKDEAFVRFAADNDIDFIAHSFVRNKEDVLAVQKILDEKKSPIKIIAKIENQSGVDHIDEILDHAYGVMVARGDLAIEVPAERIPLIQKMLVKKCKERRKPVIIATQMLQSMIHSPRPTRAEISDVGNACLDGTDAIMLSGETAYGQYPLEAVQVMTRVALEIEAGHDTFNNIPYEMDNTVTSYLSKAAVKASMRLNTVALVADTISGKTILSLAAYRGKSPIFAQCYSERTMRQLALSYGVVAHYMPQDLSSHEFLQTALTRLVNEGYFSEECLITVLAGHFGSEQGASYVEISSVRNMLKRV
ncbi:MAG: pyruvate kinase [Desulfobacteraceae bacterium]|nr:pyruvate kinase [Desulfobacteraceae bacterium]